jgi:hypothetical protein
MAHADYLSSDGGAVFLVNCDVAIDIATPRVLAGVAYLTGGIGEWIEVFDPMGRSAGRVQISPSLRQNPTSAVLSSKNDNLKFFLCR